MKSVEFRHGREASWRKLDRLLERVEADGVGALNAEELLSLPELYRAALSSLSVARAISLDRNLLDYLENLSARAYCAVYGIHRTPETAIRRFILHTFPKTVRSFRRQLVLAVLVLCLGAVVGAVLTAHDAARFWAFVPESLAQGRGPCASSEELRTALYTTAHPVDILIFFALFLFTHNAQLALGCVALGFAAGGPVIVLLFCNGLSLGAFAALYANRGLGLELWAWLLPHGVTELLALSLCGAAGFGLGEALLFPGRQTRLENLAQRGREASVVALGAVLMLLVAGLLEGIVRQLVHGLPIRWTLAIATAGFWLVYFARAGEEHP